MKKNNRLVILAHPNRDSFNHKIADTIVKNSESVFLIDLYDREWKQDFLEFKNVREDWPDDNIFKKIRKKINWSDELIFVYPIWWTAQPAILKNFIDINFSAGYAFTYKNGRPIGLLDKKVRIFSTADSPEWIIFLTKYAMKKVFLKSVLEFCGLKSLNFSIFSNISKANENKREEILNKIAKILNK